MSDFDVVIIGAGPYGLSIAAHLKALGIDFRIFGQPMQTWREHMPNGMRLKSEGFASSLYDPESAFPLETYCREKKILYSDTGVPIPLEVFSSYGVEFQKRFVSGLDQRQINSIDRSSDCFRVRCDDGTVVTSRRIVVASGLAGYEYTPPILSDQPLDLVSHSSRHHDLDHFRGQEVAIVGAGSSAVDLASLLHQVGARVQLIARRDAIRFHDPPSDGKRTLMMRLRNPATGIGPGWKLFFLANAPLAFRKLPLDFRLRKVRNTLGPAPCWFTKDEVVGKIPFHLGVNITEVKAGGNRICLRLRDTSGSEKMLSTEHVIAATGYKTDLRKLKFLESGLLASIESVENAPVLTSHFESSIPGLYFVGVAAANTFGPLLRFAVGARFAAPRISRHLAKRI